MKSNKNTNKKTRKACLAERKSIKISDMLRRLPRQRPAWTTQSKSQIYRQVKILVQMWKPIAHLKLPPRNTPAYQISSRQVNKREKVLRKVRPLFPLKSWAKSVHAQPMHDRGQGERAGGQVFERDALYIQLAQQLILPLSFCRRPHRPPFQPKVWFIANDHAAKVRAHVTDTSNSVLGWVTTTLFEARKISFRLLMRTLKHTKSKQRMKFLVRLYEPFFYVYYLQNISLQCYFK